MLVLGADSDLCDGCAADWAGNRVKPQQAGAARSEIPAAPDDCSSQHCWGSGPEGRLLISYPEPWGWRSKVKWQRQKEDADAQAVSLDRHAGFDEGSWLHSSSQWYLALLHKRDSRLFVPLCNWSADVIFEHTFYALQSGNVASAVPSTGLKALKFAEKHAASGTTRLAPHKVNTCMKTNKILEYEAEAKECLHLFPSSNYFVNLKDCMGDLTPFFLYRSNTCHRRHPS